MRCEIAGGGNFFSARLISLFLTVVLLIIRFFGGWVSLLPLLLLQQLLALLSPFPTAILRARIKHLDGIYSVAEHVRFIIAQDEF